MDALLIVGRLRDGLERTRADLEILMHTKKRDLTDDERAELPSTLQELPTAELREQIDSWVSLRMHYESLIEQFDPDNWP